MSKSTKNVYLWATEKQETWDDIADEKITQLNEILNTHLEWFTSHNTVSDLLSWRKSRYDFRGTKPQKAEPDSQTKSQKNSSSSPKNLKDQLATKTTIPDNNNIEKEDTKPTDNEFRANNHSIVEADQTLGKDLLDLEMNENSLMKHNQVEKKVLEEGFDCLMEETSVILEEMAHEGADGNGESAVTENDSALNNDPAEIAGAPFEEFDEATDDDISFSTIDRKIKVVIESPNRLIEILSDKTITSSKSEDNCESEVYEGNEDIKSNESVISIGQPSEISAAIEDSHQTNRSDTNRSDITTITSRNTTNNTVSSSTTEIPSDKSSRVQNVNTKNAGKESELSISDSQKSVVNGHSGQSSYSDNTDYDEHMDEIQLVVSKKKSMELGTPPSPTTKPSVSPIKPPLTFSKPVTRQHSSFMSRLFRLGRPSVGKSSTLSKEDSSSSLSVITTKRPSKQSPPKAYNISNVTGSTVDSVTQQEIEISDAIPERPFKHPRLMHKKKNEENKETSSQELLKKENPPKTEADTHDKIPSWALDPELQTHLGNQKSMDPDRIFGILPPYSTKEIFPTTIKTKEQ